MDTQLLKAERVAKGKSQQHMADVIGKTRSGYERKENGFTLFTADEIALIACDLELSFNKMNEIFFSSKLPYSNLSTEKITAQN